MVLTVELDLTDILMTSRLLSCSFRSPLVLPLAPRLWVTSSLYLLSDGLREKELLFVEQDVLSWVSLFMKKPHKQTDKEHNSYRRRSEPPAPPQWGRSTSWSLTPGQPACRWAYTSLSTLSGGPLCPEPWLWVWSHGPSPPVKYLQEKRRKTLSIFMLQRLFFLF